MSGEAGSPGTAGRGFRADVERWRPVVGYEGLYEVSDLGRIRTVARTAVSGRKRKEIIRKPRISRGGYHRVALSRDDKEREFAVHRLVLAAFVRPGQPGELGRHLNDQPTDNRLENLAWGSYSDNAIDRIRNGGNPLSSKTHCKRGHLLSGDNIRIEFHKTEQGPRPLRKCIPCARIRNTAVVTCAFCGSQMQQSSLRDHRRELHPGGLVRRAS